MLTRSRSRSGSKDKTKSSSTSSAKRQLSSPESNPPDKSKKRTKSTNMSTSQFDELTKLITASATNIESKISESQTILETKFTDLAKKVGEEVASIKESVGEFRIKVVNDIDSIRLQLNNHEYRIENNEDDIQRIQLNSDLRLVGFAPLENENLLILFNLIAKEIGYSTDHTNCPSLERIVGKNKTTGNFMPTATILMHFATSRHKKAFYLQYLNKMPLNPTKFGLPDEKRIIIGENLTRKNASLFKQAQIMKRNKIILQTYTEDGLVKIKVNKGETAVIVRNPTELEYVVAQHQLL